MVRPQRPARCLAMTLIIATSACGDPSPLKPDPVQRLTGTYPFTVAMSASGARPVFLEEEADRVLQEAADLGQEGSSQGAVDDPVVAG